MDKVLYLKPLVPFFSKSMPIVQSVNVQIMFKKQSLTSVWSVQHPKTGQNKQ